MSDRAFSGIHDHPIEINGLFCKQNKQNKLKFFMELKTRSHVMVSRSHVMIISMV
jgi:hypothetical protein